MLLTLTDIEHITANRYSELWLSGYYENDKEQILKVLWENNSFINESKWISSLQWLSVNICSHINKNISDILANTNNRVLQTRLIIKSDIAFFLQEEKITILVDLLKKIPNLSQWWPSTLEAIWRTDSRDRNPKIESIEIFSDNEQKYANNLKTWFSTHIRKYNEEKESEIDWDRIVFELMKIWEINLAQLFQKWNLSDNFKRV